MHLTSLIRTRRCEIDTLTPDLVTQNQVDWLNSPEVNRFLEARFTHHTVTTQREYVRSLLISREHLMLNIFDMSRNASIGTCSVHFQTRHNTAEIGILIGERSVWGEGYGQEVINGVSNFLFKKMSVRKITAGTYSKNEASVNLFKKCGFFVEGIRRNQVVDQDGQYDDVVLFGFVNNQL